MTNSKGDIVPGGKRPQNRTGVGRLWTKACPGLHQFRRRKCWNKLLSAGTQHGYTLGRNLTIKASIIPGGSNDDGPILLRCKIDTLPNEHMAKSWGGLLQRDQLSALRYNWQILIEPGAPVG